jgi:uncharacterized membrane protein YkoI
MNKVLFIIGVFLFLLGHPTDVWGGEPPNKIAFQQVLYAKSSGHKNISAQQAARLVKNKYGGKVLKVQSKKVNGSPGYKVKLLKENGHVISVNVDGKTGKTSGR